MWNRWNGRQVTVLISLVILAFVLSATGGAHAQDQAITLANAAQ
jgi:hypothetical protein